MSQEALAIPPSLIPTAKLKLTELAVHGWTNHDGKSIGSKSAKRGLTRRRDALAMLTCWQLALRSAECVKLRYDQVDVVSSRVLVAGLKRGRTDSFKLPSTLAATIQNWRSQALTSLNVGDTPAECFFTSRGRPMHEKHVQRATRDFFGLLGLPPSSGYSSHSFRATAAVEAYNRDGLKAAQYLLRHKSPRTTEIYINKQLENDFEISPAFVPDLIRDGAAQDARDGLATPQRSERAASVDGAILKLYAG